MKVTQEGFALIKSCEGFRSEAYRDAGGVWTVGYGHTSAVGAPEVAPQMRLSEAEANEVLQRDVDNVARRVSALVKVPLTDAQFSALVSFTYNVGAGAFAGSSVLMVINSGDFARVPERLALWNKGGGRVLPGLVKRRAAEAAMFLSNGAVATQQAQLGFWSWLFSWMRGR